MFQPFPVAYALIFHLLHCGASHATHDIRRVARVKNIRDVSTRINDFSFNLFKELVSVTNGNVLYSPFSIFTSLTMLGIGANGTTKQQISDALKWGKEDSVLRNLKCLSNKLWKENKQSGYRLAMAKRLWITDHTEVLKPYRRKLAHFFKSTIRQKSFASNPEEARRGINQWIEKKTNKSIKNFFPFRSFDSQTQLVMANAISFKGKWTKPFERQKTHKGKFYTGDDGYVMTDFMTTEYEFPAYFDEKTGAQTLEIPYSGGIYSMIVVMPQTHDFHQFEKTVTPLQLDEWIKKLTLKHATWSTKTIFLPKFKIEQSLPVVRLLKNLSIKDLFYPLKADLSGIDGKRSLFCSRAIHKSYIEVDEEGSPVVSVTGVGMTMLSHPLTVHLNRPFLFYIIHRTTSLILFSGKLVRPETESASSTRSTEQPVTNNQLNEESLHKTTSILSGTKNSSCLLFWLQICGPTIFLTFGVIGILLLTHHRHRGCCLLEADL